MFRLFVTLLLPTAAFLFGQVCADASVGVARAARLAHFQKVIDYVRPTNWLELLDPAHENGLPLGPGTLFPQLAAQVPAT